jgi:predicted PurR-regulated permease PerM
MKKNLHNQILIFVAFFISAIIIIPTFKQLITAMIISFLFYPIYKFLLNKIKSKGFCSIIIIILIIFLFFIPFLTLSSSFVSQINKFSDLITNNKTIDNETFMVNQTNLNKKDIINYDNSSKDNKSIIYYLNKNQTKERKINIIGIEIKSKEIDYITNYLKNSISQTSNDITKSLITNYIPNLLANLVITLLYIFFFLIEGEKIYYFFKKITPLAKKTKKLIFNNIYNTSKAVIFGQILVSIIQGASLAIGLIFAGFFLGISDTGWALWGILTMFASIIPIVGTTLIWLPLGLTYIFVGINFSQNPFIGFGVFILIWGTTVVAQIDNIIRPKIIGNLASINEFVVLVGVIGGIKLLGFPGLFAGPLILGLCIKIITIYFKQNKKKDKEENRKEDENGIQATKN